MPAHGSTPVDVPLPLGALGVAVVATSHAQCKIFKSRGEATLGVNSSGRVQASHPNQHAVMTPVDGVIRRPRVLRRCPVSVPYAPWPSSSPLSARSSCKRIPVHFAAVPLHREPVRSALDSPPSYDITQRARTYIASAVAPVPSSQPHRCLGQFDPYPPAPVFCLPIAASTRCRAMVCRERYGLRTHPRAPPSWPASHRLVRGLDVALAWAPGLSVVRINAAHGKMGRIRLLDEYGGVFILHEMIVSSSPRAAELAPRQRPSACYSLAPQR
ncbi:hypothetical protein B0H13DRAFT_2341939 [Mycena leptocephala]|nr:hypothetical protein B0H13DRAFT_2341939 [Mycena leptocephala]